MSYRRKIYNTLSNTTDPLAVVEVDALGFNVECGEVPSNNYTIKIGSISDGISIVVSANMGGRAIGLCLPHCPLRLAISHIVASQVYRPTQAPSILKI